MTTRITVAILLITWTIIIVCFSAAFFTSQAKLLTMLDDSVTARASTVLEYSLNPREPVDSLLPPGDTYEIRDESGGIVKKFAGDLTSLHQPVVMQRQFETAADGTRYRTLTIELAPSADQSAGRTIKYSRPATRFDSLLTYLIVVLCSLGLFCGLATGLVALMVSRAALRPLRETANKIAAIDEKNLSVRIDEQKLPVELVPMTKRLNEMLGRLERVFEQRKQFLADAAHELRTPTAALLTTLEVSLRRQRDQKALVEAMGTALADARLLRRLVDKLLEHARSDNAMDRPVLEELDVAGLLSDCVTTVRSMATEKEVELVKDVPAELKFLTQRDRILSIVLNLLTNAIEYNRSGGRVEIRCAMDGETLVLSVRDTGQGISPEALPHVFEPFYRADRQKQGDTDHLGLGLFLVQSHIRALGGHCQIESKSGEGTTVRVTLPTMTDKGNGEVEDRLAAAHA